MPSNSPQLLYWDACILLSYIGRHSERFADIDACMAEAAQGEYEIVTSTYTVAEVAFAAQERDERALDPAVEKSIEKLWLPTSPIKLVDLHIGIAERARTLSRNGMISGRRLRPGDAIHLATAIDLGVDALNTYNLADFKRWAAECGFDVSEPAPRALRLDVEGVLSDPPTGPPPPA
jgi:predicted nucleic acid-binding protein